MSTRSDRRAISDLLLGIVLAATALLSHAPLMQLTAGGCDEWHILQIGANLRDGHLLYRDSNHISGPGAFYLAAGLFEWFGERFEVGRTAVLVLFAWMVVATYGLTRRLTGPVPATLAALWLIGFRLWTFPHFQIYHYATIGLALVTTAVFVLHAERSVRVLRAGVAGLLAGLAFVTKQDSGALGIIACVLALLLGMAVRQRATQRRESFAPVWTLIVAAAFPFLACCTYFAWRGVLGPFLWQTIYDPIFLHPLYVSGAGPTAGDYLGMPPLFPLFGQDRVLRSFLFSWMPGLVWDLFWREILESWVYRETNLIDLALKLGFRLPYLVLALEAFSLLRAWGELRTHPERARAVAAQAAQLAWAGAMLAAFSKPRDWIHLSILLVPFAPLVARQITASLRSVRGWPRRLWAGALATFGLLFAATTTVLGIAAAATYTAPVSGKRGTVFVRPEDAVSFGELIDSLAATPADRPVLIVPCLPIATFLSDRPPLTRFIWLWPRDAYADRDQQVIRRLEEYPDASVVYVLMHTPFTPRPQATVPNLFAYLAEHYRIGEVIGPSPERMMCALAERRPAPGGESLRLTDSQHLAGARAVRTQAGEMAELPFNEIGGVATWPLTPRVLHVTPGEGGESRVILPVDVPAETHPTLQLRAGVNPDLWQSLGPFPLRLRVEILADGERTELLSVEKDVYSRAGDRLWTPLEVDLTPWAGRRIEVVLATEALGWKPGSREIAGFEDPRLEWTRRAAHSDQALIKTPAAHAAGDRPPWSRR